ncbi:MAG: hypothetical protein EPO57_07320 [Chitinophagaceae bacterium]|nr:MAG: hypothetical protein EPO57_07320 [Chitinophagaceae bacterium]
MKKFLQLTSGIIIVCFFCASGCGKECEEPFDIKQSGLTCIFKNSAGLYLYAQLNPLYNKDSLTIHDEIGNRYSAPPYIALIPNTSSGYWEFDFGPLYNSQTDSESFNREICKNFIIHYKYNETDTIKTCYKANKTECGTVFSSLKVFHKGVLLKEVNNHFLATVTITKN